MKISKSDIDRLAQVGGETEENLRKLYEWVHASEALIIQLWAAALVAVIGASLAALFGYFSSGGTGKSWWLLVVFGISGFIVMMVVCWRWKYLDKVKKEFLEALELYKGQTSVPTIKLDKGEET